MDKFDVLLCCSVILALRVWQFGIKIRFYLPKLGILGVQNIQIWYPKISQVQDKT